MRSFKKLLNLNKSFLLTNPKILAIIKILAANKPPTKQNKKQKKEEKMGGKKVIKKKFFKYYCEQCHLPIHGEAFIFTQAGPVHQKCAVKAAIKRLSAAGLPRPPYDLYIVTIERWLYDRIKAIDNESSILNYEEQVAAIFDAADMLGRPIDWSRILHPAPRQAAQA